MRTVGARVAAIALASCTFLGCIVEAPSGESSNSNNAPGASRSAAAPAATPVTVKTGAVLGNKVELVGAQFQPGQVVPGQPTRVALYFRTLDTVGADYSVFVHVEDADGQLPRTNFDHQPTGGKYPTSQWKKGDMVRDEFSIYVAPGAQARALNIYVGLWNPANDERLPLSNPDKVRNDGLNRVFLAQLPVAQF